MYMLLVLASAVFLNRSCSLYTLGTDRIENNSPNSSSIVVSRSYGSDSVKNTIPVIV
jgi:hypothetical protein